MFYCETVEVATEKGEIFTILSTVNTGRQLKIKIDTGARCNVLPRTILDYIGSNAHIDHSHAVNLVAYGGQVIRTMGDATVNFTCGTLQFHIVNGDMKPLLGLTDSVKLGFVKPGPKVHVLQQEVPELTEYRDLFDCSTIGKLPVVYRMRLDDSVHPTISSPRRVPLAMKDKIIEELNRIKLGVIKPVQKPTEWVSAVVAACKKEYHLLTCQSNQNSFDHHDQ
ncbi:hypothetical protein ACEWY4_008455 [Coilia grayii]|uniref:Peptidase A2 domain-containing protein n=1 Tax=Coilia grayii TaxID=363190 RepID=A0ABD1KAY7_9TELE